MPAHIWTPWFAALGSKSGFDSIDRCYADLSPHIFAVETGLSSDPPMNWRVSSLDRFRLVSNSDAHSPEKLGREACVFTDDLDYFAYPQGTGNRPGICGHRGVFPRRKASTTWTDTALARCGWEPHETRAVGGVCAVCGKPLTVGVMHRGGSSGGPHRRRVARHRGRRAEPRAAARGAGRNSTRSAARASAWASTTNSCWANSAPSCRCLPTCRWTTSAA